MALVSGYNDAQKAALLASIATQGSAGANAYATEQNAAQQTAQQAAAGAQQRSSLIGAPDALTSELAASGGDIANTYSRDAAGGANALAAFQSALKGGNAQYMAQIGDANALAKLITDAYQKQSEDTREFNTDQARRDFVQHASDREAEAAARKQAEDWAREQHGWDVENHQYELDKRNSAANDPFATISNGEKATLLAYARQYASGAHPGKMRKPGGKDYKVMGATVAHNPFGGKPGEKGRNKVTISDALDALNSDLGKPKGWVQAVLGKDSPDYKGKAEKVDPQKLRQTKSYKANHAALAAHYQKLISGKGHITVAAARAQLADAIRSDPKYPQHPNVYEQLIRDILHA